LLKTRILKLDRKNKFAKVSLVDSQSEFGIQVAPAHAALARHKASVGRAKQLLSRALPISGQNPDLLHHSEHSAAVHVKPERALEEPPSKIAEPLMGSPFRPEIVMTEPIERISEGVKYIVMVLKPHETLELSLK